MPRKPLKKAKYSKNKSKEKDTIATLTLLLKGADVLAQITGGDDDFPNIDGYFYLLNKERDVTGQMLQVQIKPLSYNKDRTKVSARCRTTLLAHAQGAANPVLIIGVDPENNTAYWSYLSPEFVNRYQEEEGSDKLTTTIYFPSKNKIEVGKNDYVKQWRDICRHHRNESNDKIITRLLGDSDDRYSSDSVSPARLETLGYLAFYRTTGGHFPVIEPILSLAPVVHQSTIESKVAYVKTLEGIFYHKMKEVLQILYSLILEDERTFESIKKVLVGVSKYNYHVLTSIGYEPQRTLVDTIDALINAEDPKFKLLAVEILRNMLESDFDGTTNKGYTITFHRGALQGSPYLAKLRRDAIEKLFKMVEGDNSLAVKVDALKGLSHALHNADHGLPDAALLNIVNADTNYIVERYSKVVLDASGKPVESFPLVYEVERQLALLKVWKRPAPEIEPLLKTLRSSGTDYRFYRLFVGEEHDLRIELGFNEVRDLKEKEVVENLDSINLTNVEEWYSRLNKVAAYKNQEEFWRFNTFRDFLARIAVQKPEVADKLLGVIFDQKSHLYSFSGSLLFGLRKSSLPIWSKYVELIKKDGSQELTDGVLTSFEAIPWSEQKMRPEDSNLLVEAARASGSFEYLKKAKDDRGHRYQVFRTLLYTYTTDPTLFRALLLEQMRDYPSYERSFFDQIGFAVFTKWMTFEDWSREELEKIADLLVEAKEHDHNHDQVMHELGKKDFELMMSVYGRRLEREAKRYESRYRAVPYNITPDLVEFIREHSQYEQILKTWISKSGPRRDLYNMHLGKLIDQVGGDAYSQAVNDLISTGKDSDLRKIVALFPFSEPPNFDVCFQIVEATDNKEIWRSIAGQMQNTGGLTGNINDNIFGNALRRIKDDFQKKLDSTSTSRIKDFCRMCIESLDLQIKDADERHQKEMDRRQAEQDEAQED